MPEETTLEDLARKLIETYHLNVPERAALPDGKMPFTALVSAAGSVVIEMRPDGYWLHEQHEIGVPRCSTRKIRTSTPKWPEGTGCTRAA